MWPLASSWGTTSLAVLIGIAKPIPTEPLPEPPVSIWALIPITRPAPSSSGPPELPGLIEASVWITWSIENPLGALIDRWTAEMIPVVTVFSSPNGLPIAIASSPTWMRVESPSESGWSLVLRSEEHTSELQSQSNLVCRLLLEKKKTQNLLFIAFQPPAHALDGDVGP